MSSFYFTVHKTSDEIIKLYFNKFTNPSDFKDGEQVHAIKFEEYEKLEQENKKLREALEVYADNKMYNYFETCKDCCDDCDCSFDIPLLVDSGFIAREALSVK